MSYDVPRLATLIKSCRIFELFIAFDALRLRNTIQLIGLLRQSPVQDVALSYLVSRSVFHAALVVGAALQVYETKTGLVTLEDCDGTFDYVVRRDAVWYLLLFP